MRPHKQTADEIQGGCLLFAVVVQNCVRILHKLQEVSGSVLRQNKKEFIINLVYKIGRMR